MLARLREPRERAGRGGTAQRSAHAPRSIPTGPGAMMGGGRPAAAREGAPGDPTHMTAGDAESPTGGAGRHPRPVSAGQREAGGVGLSRLLGAQRQGDS